MFMAVVLKALKQFFVGMGRAPLLNANITFGKILLGST